MPGLKSRPTIIRFGAFEVDLRTSEVRKRGLRIKIQEQQFRILCLLLSSPGDLVTREEIRRVLWTNDTFVDFENGLNAAVAKLRQALGDSADNPRFVETLPRRGYRFIAPVTVLENDGGAVARPAEAKAQPRETTAPAPQSRPRTIWLRTAAVVSVGALAVLIFLIARSRLLDDRAAFSYDVERVTSRGDVVEAVISPDANSIAYIAGAQEKSTLRMRTLATGQDREVPGVRQGPMHGIAFYPDSERICIQLDHVVYEVPIRGGAPTKLLGGRADVDFATPSPDGSKVAFTAGPPAAGDYNIFVARPDGSEQHRIVHYRFPFFLYGPAWSPEGGQLAFAATPSGFFLWDLIAQAPSVGATAHIITPRHFYRIQDHAWLRGGKALAFAGVESAGIRDFQIWAVTYKSGKMTRITNGLDSYTSVSANADSRLLGAVREQIASEILLVSGRGDVLRHLTTLGPAAEGMDALTFLGDTRLVFASQASGTGELWMVDCDGNNRRRLTDNGARNLSASAPKAGNAIYWDTHGRTPGFWVMDADGGNVRRISPQGGWFWSDQGKAPGAPQGGLSRISPDGKFIVFLSFASSGKQKLMRTDTNHLTEPVALSELPAAPIQPAISPDGRWIAFNLHSSDGLQRGTVWAPNRVAVVPAARGDPVAVLPVWGWSIQWSADGKSLMYIRAQGGADNIWTVPVFGGQARQVTHFEEGTIFRFALSPTGKYLAIVHGSRSTDAVLLRSTQKE